MQGIMSLLIRSLTLAGIPTEQFLSCLFSKLFVTLKGSFYSKSGKVAKGPT